MGLTPPTDGLVLAAVDWTVVAAAAVTGATAVVVGLIGLFSTRVSASVGQRQIDAEAERLREQHREIHFERRQDLYLKLVNADRRLVARLNAGEPLDRSDVHPLYEAIAEFAYAATVFARRTSHAEHVTTS